MSSLVSIIPFPFPSCCPKGNSFNSFVNEPLGDMSDCNSTTSRFTVFFSLRIGERVFRNVIIDATDLVGVGGAGRIGRERLGCTGITQGPRSLKAVAKLVPVPRCNLLELSAIMMRGSEKSGIYIVRYWRDREDTRSIPKFSGSLKKKFPKFDHVIIKISSVFLVLSMSTIF